VVIFGRSFVVIFGRSFVVILGRSFVVILRKSLMVFDRQLLCTSGEKTAYNTLTMKLDIKLEQKKETD